MSCFDVQILEPSGRIIEIETTIGNSISTISIDNYVSPNIEVTACISQLPSDFNSIVSGLLPVKNIIGDSGVLIVNSNGIFTISTTGVPFIDNSGNLLSYILIDGGTP